MKAGVSLFRDKHGVAHIKADSLIDLFWGQGYAHGTDRLMQMCLMRVIGQGRICELLNDDDSSLAVDLFFRRMNWSKNVGKELEKLNVEDHAALEAYCQGVNSAMQKSTPWEFKILGHTPEPWKPKDCILISRMMGYLTLAQSQAEMERLLVEMVQAGVEKDLLDELFPGILGGFDFELINKITLGERLVKPASLWNQAIPRAMASNNWVISAKKSKSGKPLLANDPHLEANRLPNVWYENVLLGNDRYMMGASLPGIPGVMSGRNNDVAWGVTYAFIDTIDSWVEQCKDGRYYRESGKEEEQWHDFELRRETIRRKKSPSVVMTYFENEHGLLDGDPNIEGYYLATCWAAAGAGVASLAAMMNLWSVTDMHEAKSQIAKIETGWSFVLADVKGDIGFQMTGKVPIRAKGISGFVPLAGWEKKNNWQGFAPPHLMPQKVNPDEGYFITANNNLNEHGYLDPINICMASYRADRIKQLIDKEDKLGWEEMCKMQFDLHSLQAEAFMKILKPLLPATHQGDILKNWDYRYDSKSQGAYLFELVLKSIYHDVFGLNGMGGQTVKYLATETGIFNDFYDNFDRVLLSEKSKWFGKQSRDEIFKAAAARALQLPVKTWGQAQQLKLKNIFFDGKLPDIFGFDKGPITVEGGRATVQQGQIYRSDGRVTSFMPSIRMVCDLAEPCMHSNLLGGPSDRRFSKWYANDIRNWQRGVYKQLTPMPRKKFKFK